MFGSYVLNLLKSIVMQMTPNFICRLVLTHLPMWILLWQLMTECITAIISQQTRFSLIYRGMYIANIPQYNIAQQFYVNQKA